MEQTCYQTTGGLLQTAPNAINCPSHGRKRNLQSILIDFHEITDNTNSQRCQQVKQLCLEEEDNNKIVQLCQTKTKQRKTVQFNMHANSIHCLKRPLYLTSEILLRAEDKSVIKDDDSDCDSFRYVGSKSSDDRDRTTLWYSKIELKTMKYQAKRFASRLGLGDELAAAIATFQDATLKNDGNSTLCASLVPNLDLFMVQRGLERWSNPMQAMDRSIQAIICKTNFFLEQANQIAQKNPDCIKLANLYHNSSLLSVQFAQVLGELDSTVVKAMTD